MYSINRRMILAVLTSTACFLGSPLFSQPTVELAKTSEDFIEVAQKSIPAVVFIQVKAKSKAKSSFFYNGSEVDSDFFGEDFLGRFFGLPRREAYSPPQTGQASGFIISKDGYILTNNHVIQDQAVITVQLNDGREYSAKVIGEDQTTDLALIKIDADNLPFLNLGDSEDLRIGQWVVAIGNPLGLQASLTVGVVSAKGRSNLDIARIEDFIQTDAAINRGNSGGPLLNLKGEVIGINTAIATNMSSGYLGIGFAIPSNIAKHVVEQLQDSGSVTRGFLGVTLQGVDQDLAQAFELKKIEGALIADVTKNSPAEKAGLKQGDIIVKYDDRKIENIGAFRNAVALRQPGSPMTLTVLREKQVLKIPVEIARFPEEDKRPVDPMITNNKYGFDVKTLTPEIAKSLGLNDELSGIVVTHVSPNGPASLAGIKKGALILAINQKKVATGEEFYRELHASTPGKPVLLLINYHGTMRFISMKVD
ncbi:putative periplasmic serine endoprotease DegP-like [Chlamydiales bacterium STE3]|nr:putative periplasmic serine endoprotease DegP-like [Chlamydiales bacterium STE3]